MAAEVNTPDHHPRSSRDSIRWGLLALLFIALVTLPIFLLELILLGLLRNGDNFGTVKEVPRYTKTQYTAPTPPLHCLRPSSDGVPTQRKHQVDVGIGVVLLL